MQDRNYHRNLTIRRHLINVIIMSGGAFFVWYFSGPIGGEILRHGYESFYNLLYGTPSRFDPEYLFYMTNRGHITNFGYQWSEYICAGLCAPLFYGLSNTVNSYFEKRQHSRRIDPHKHKQNETSKIQNVLLELKKVIQEKNNTVSQTPEETKKNQIPIMNDELVQLAEKIIEVHKHQHQEINNNFGNTISESDQTESGVINCQLTHDTNNISQDPLTGNFNHQIMLKNTHNTQVGLPISVKETQFKKKKN